MTRDRRRPVLTSRHWARNNSRDSGFHVRLRTVAQARPSAPLSSV